MRAPEDWQQAAHKTLGERLGHLDLPNHLDSSRCLSREHLRFCAAQGRWQVSQLGQMASLVVGRAGATELRQGMSMALMEGDRIFVVGQQGVRMGLELRHRSVRHGHVLESELCRLSQ